MSFLNSLDAGTVAAWIIAPALVILLWSFLLALLGAVVRTIKENWK